MAKRKRRYTNKTKGRMLIIFLMFSTVICTLGYTLFSDLQKINILINEKKELQNKEKELVEKQESLKADIDRLSDSEYVARYAREKYFYSKNGEFILRIED